MNGWPFKTGLLFYARTDIIREADYQSFFQIPTYLHAQSFNEGNKILTFGR